MSEINFNLNLKLKLNSESQPEHWQFTGTASLSLRLSATGSGPGPPPGPRAPGLVAWAGHCQPEPEWHSKSLSLRPGLTRTPSRRLPVTVAESASLRVSDWSLPVSKSLTRRTQAQARSLPVRRHWQRSTISPSPPSLQVPPLSRSEAYILAHWQSVDFCEFNMKVVTVRA